MRLLIIGVLFVVLLITPSCKNSGTDIPIPETALSASADTGHETLTCTATTAATTQAPKPTYTREDFDEMRKTLVYKPFEIDYTMLYNNNGYLEIDKTAGVLEQYLHYSLMGLEEAYEIPDVLQDNNLIFQAAGFCAHGFGIDETPLIHYVGAWYSSTPKEHLDLTVKYLFGDKCVIDYENLETSGYYGYAEETGLALRYSIKKERLSPLILDYKDMGDHFQATVVFLEGNTFLPPGYDYYYSDETTGDYICLTKAMAQEFCRSDKPDRYSVRLDKGNGEELYLRSVLLIPKS